MLDPVAADEEEPGARVEPARLDHGEPAADRPAEPPVQLEAPGEPCRDAQKTEHGQERSRPADQIEDLHGRSVRTQGGVAAPRPFRPVEPIELVPQSLALGGELDREPLELVEKREQGGLLLRPGGRPSLGLGEGLETALERLEADRAAGREALASRGERRLERAPVLDAVGRYGGAHGVVPCRRAAASRASSR
mgnify:CR=1 FL=1